MPRTIFIGDVHGCSRELRNLMDLVKPTTDDEIIFVGDLVDKGADTNRSTSNTGSTSRAALSARVR